MDVETYKKLLLDNTKSDNTVFYALLEFFDDDASTELTDAEHDELDRLNLKYRPEVNVRLLAHIFEIFVRSDADRVAMLKEYSLESDATFLDIARAVANANLDKNE